MHHRSIIAAAAAIFSLAMGTGQAGAAAPEVGEPAPSFAGTTADGQTVDLAQYRGKTVVLEWTNHDCPYVRKHYGAKNMQALQKQAADDGIVWLSVISSAPGRQGYLEGPDALKVAADHGAAPAGIVLDPDGKIGKAYAARTTPHMYIVTPDGTLAYKGGIDDKATANPADIPGATNYVKVALAELAGGKPVSNPSTRAYGCSVKYAW
ncbi:MAG: redoxin domain-containing protein [Alphaproteobacteria bacterium]